jgi:RNA polymerase sigma-70 factor (ECF subfamily)
VLVADVEGKLSEQAGARAESDGAGRVALDHVTVDRLSFEHAEFVQWVQPHLAVLRGVARREVGAADADDVVQETLIRAWQRRRTYDRARGSARAWLLAVLLDRARRHRVRRRPAAALVDDEASGDGGSVERLDIEAAIRALPARQRQIVTLHYLADLTQAEVAALVGITEGAVKSQLSAARAALRTRLDG